MPAETVAGAMVKDPWIVELNAIDSSEPRMASGLLPRRSSVATVIESDKTDLLIVLYFLSKRL